MPSAAEFMSDYVATFNAAVTSGDFGPLLARFTDDAVLRFENVPPDAAVLDFAGRAAYTAAYTDHPPDDQISLSGEPTANGRHVVAAFAWQRAGSPGVLDLTVSGDLISAMTVIFG